MTIPELNPTIEDLIRLCRRESARPRVEECGHCFELFRRAIEGRESQAWAAVESQYQGMVWGWLGGVPESSREHLVRESFSRFWRILSRCIPLQARFEHTGALLKYLRQCVISVMLDHRRQEVRLERVRRRCEQVELIEPPSSSALDALCQEQRLQRVRHWLDGNVKDPVELRILELSYELDLQPVEIVARYPTEFADVQEVRRIKERILRRVKRALAEAPGED